MTEKLRLGDLIPGLTPAELAEYRAAAAPLFRRLPDWRCSLGHRFEGGTAIAPSDPGVRIAGGGPLCPRCLVAWIEQNVPMLEREVPDPMQEHDDEPGGMRRGYIWKGDEDA